MLGIDEMAQSIRKKISLKDLEPSSYFTEETKKKFNEIYAKRILAGFKTDKAGLLREAIDILYEKEKTKDATPMSSK